MTPFIRYQQSDLYIEDVSLSTLAQHYGTPVFAYSANQIIANWTAYDQHLLGIENQICYSVKANSNLSILSLLDQLGSGFDIVSGGELARCLRVGIPAKRIVFSGVGKTSQEITDALSAGIGCFNVESGAELYEIERIAQSLNTPAPIAIRVNPDVDAKTHPYITTGLHENKFGVTTEQAIALYQHAEQSQYLAVQGIDCHIGSQLTDISPYQDALEKVLALINTLHQSNVKSISHINMGGGLGIDYQNQSQPDIATLCSIFTQRLKSSPLDFTLYIEPGRSIIGNAGILLTQVLYTKSNGHKHFAIVDAGMNDLMRPSLYQAQHKLLPIKQTPDSSSEHTPTQYDIVGPVCESADCFFNAYEGQLQAKDLLAILDCGAYGASMSSNYNTRPRACEVLVEGHTHRAIRQRESIDDLMATELSALA